MLNYIKLQFNYLFSWVYLGLYVLLLFCLLVGMLISANLDLGKLYLDGQRIIYALEYLQQSLMITEITIGIFMIFSTSLLISKSNEGLYVYTVSNRLNKFRFIISRIFTGILLNLYTVGFAFIIFMLVCKLLTPFNYDISFILSLYALIALKVVFFQAIVFVIQAYSNNFFLIIFPIILFWYMQTLDIYQENFSEIQTFLIEIVPLFNYEDYEIIVYKDLTQYFAINILIMILSYLISSIKDHG